jgi:hypothetical protein
MTHDEDFRVPVQARAGGLTLAEIERLLHEEGHDQSEIDYTLWLIATCREHCQDQKQRVRPV